MNWKAIAIGLAIILLVENAAFLWLLDTGMKIIEKEEECAVLCTDHGEYYYFSDVGDVCYCYEGDEIVHKEKIG